MLFFSVTMLLLLPLLFTMDTVGASTCPILEEDPCMNEQNLQKCQTLVDKGCTNLIWMKSCPLHFACGSYESNSSLDSNSSSNSDKSSIDHNHEESNNSSAKNHSHGNLRVKPQHSQDEQEHPQQQKGKQENTSEPKPNVPPPDACVTLAVYADDKCTEGPNEPRRTMTFPTWREPGSPCYYDVSMRSISVKDQYCNLATGNWHETIFMGTKDCSTKHKWWWPYHDSDGFDVTFTTDSCIGGYRLVNCHAGPCSRNDGKEEEDEDDDDDDQGTTAAFVAASIPLAAM